jgi:SH3 domain-containing protein
MRGLLETRMKRAPLALWLIGAIVYATNGAGAQPVETASFQSEQVELHSVSVDTPQVISLSHASPEAWGTLPSSVQLDEPRPAIDQAAQTSLDLNEIELLKVNSAANIRSGPSASAEIIGIAYAGAEVRVASRDSGWVQIIDPWSSRTGWVYSKFLAPLAIPSAPADTFWVDPLNTGLHETVAINLSASPSL